MFEKIQKTDIVDPKWLKDQEAVLRAHIRSNPVRPPKFSAIASAAIILGLIGILVFTAYKPTSNLPSGTPTPSVSSTSTPLPTESSSPTPTPGSSVTPTPTHTDKPTPTPTKTPPPEQSPSPSSKL